MAAGVRLLSPLALLLLLIEAEALVVQQPVQPTAYPGNIYILPDPAAAGGPSPGPGPAPGPSPGPAGAPSPAAGPAPAPLVPPDYRQHGSDWFMGMCRSRARQSPINFERLVSAPPSNYMDYHYTPISGAATLTATEGMLTVDLSQQEWGGTVFGGEMYLLDSIVFHGPAEHLIANYRNPLELQMVHRSMKNPAHMLMVAVPIWCEQPLPPPVPPNLPPPPVVPPNKNEMDFNALLQQFLTVPLPVANGGSSALELAELDLGQLVETPGAADAGTFFSYAGSDTRPPCVDSTIWFVRRSALVASNGQVAALQHALYQITNNFGSYRDVMPSNKRIIEIFKLRNMPAFVMPVNTGLPWGGNPRTDSEFQAQKLAQQAQEKAENSAYYMEDLAKRMRNGDRAFARRLWEPPTEAPPGGTELDRQIDYRRAVNRVRDAIQGAARGAQRVVDSVFRGQAANVYQSADLLHDETMLLHGIPSPAPAAPSAAPAPAPAAR